MGLILSGGAIAALMQVDTSETLTWQRRILQFTDVTLAEAIAALNHYSEIQLRVGDPALAAASHGRLLGRRPGHVAEILKLYPWLELSRSGDESLVTCGASVAVPMLVESAPPIAL
ncbi:hypothetical protein [Hyphomonas oceanitis]|uniref:Uncharacterized protein n=1 Tax=Hyphomonas oceanitis SCH89 TaxID=1280953 RepID=A0A059G4Z4_9PROT|nr:hypothetical protein [Hyphomonas oceanitis]KDA01882.1 hypothetical protein HOC_13234 [Hyphomonas oceanitis SCH89]